MPKFSKIYKHEDSDNITIFNYLHESEQPDSSDFGIRRNWNLTIIYFFVIKGRMETSFLEMVGFSWDIQVFHCTLLLFTHYIILSIYYFKCSFRLHQYGVFRYSIVIIIGTLLILLALCIIFSGISYNDHWFVRFYVSLK